MAALLATSTFCVAQTPGEKLLGDWTEPGGSVVRITACGPSLCLTLLKLPPNPPALVDHKNPDEALRQRPLCGLQIGYDFHPSTPDSAGSGWLYDPRAGKTYHGEMTLHGDDLALRGYTGARLFGRTEHWARAGTFTPCAK